MKISLKTMMVGIVMLLAFMASPTFASEPILDKDGLYGALSSISVEMPGDLVVATGADSSFTLPDLNYAQVSKADYGGLGISSTGKSEDETSLMCKSTGCDKVASLVPI